MTVGLNRNLIRFISNQLQAGKDSPEYEITVKKLEEIDSIAPYNFHGNDGGSISIEVNDSRDMGAATATVTMENVDGLKSPEPANTRPTLVILAVVVQPKLQNILTSESAQYTVVAHTNEGDIDVTYDAVWTITGPHEATISHGLVSGSIGQGQYTITATYEGASDSATVYITERRFDVYTDTVILKIWDWWKADDIVRVKLNDTIIEDQYFMSNEGKEWTLHLNTGINMLYIGGEYNGDDPASPQPYLITARGKLFDPNTGADLFGDIDFTMITPCGSVSPNTYFIVWAIVDLAHGPINPNPTYPPTHTSDNVLVHFDNVFVPENPCQIKLGYGDIIVPVITGALDSVEIDSKDATLKFEMRDNMRYLIDQNIDGVKFGRQLSYPRNDLQVQGPHINNLYESNSSTKVVKTINISDYLNVRSGPSYDYSVTGRVLNNQTFSYLGTINGWYNILCNGKSCYIPEYYGKLQSATLSSLPDPVVGYIKIVNCSSYTLRQGPSLDYGVAGWVQQGEVYAYSEKVGEWYHINYKGRNAYVREHYAEVVTNNEIPPQVDIPYFKVLNTPCPVRSDPSSTGNEIVSGVAGDRYKYLASSGSWFKVQYNDSITGWVFAGNGVIVFGEDTPPVDTADVIFLPDQDETKTQWKAVDIVLDLAVQATTIQLEGPSNKYSRSICKVMVEDFLIKQDGELANYTIPEVSFGVELSYYDSAMQIVNQLGDMLFKCTRYGDIYLHRFPQATEKDDPDWYITDYVDLTSLTYKLDKTDIRNRVIIETDNGWTMFEHKGITTKILKGVNMTTSMRVPWADTQAKRKEAARSFFRQVLSHFHSITIAIAGNPLVEIGQICKIKDKITKLENLFQIKEYKHDYTNDGFITTLNLEAVISVTPAQVSFVTDAFPSYIRNFAYKLQVNGGSTNKIVIKLKDPLTMAKIAIGDSNGKVLAHITVEPVGGYNATGNEDTSTKKYVVLDKSGVNLRTSPSLSSTVKRIEQNGYEMEYLGIVGDFYEGRDSDGEIVYLWKNFCYLTESTGQPVTTSTVRTADGNAFVQLIESKVGCGYEWGANGEVLTPEGLSRLKRTYGDTTHNYPACSTKWYGKQVFDCSGLICWCMKKLNIISSGEDYGAGALYSRFCTPISKSQLQPGDLIFCSNSSGIYHVGCYVGNGYYVAAENTEEGVIKRKMYAAFNKFGRVNAIANLASYTTSSVTNINQLPLIQYPTQFNITTTYALSSAPLDAAAKASALHGNVLFYDNDCVLYNIKVESTGAPNDQITLMWANTKSNPKTLDLTYSIQAY